MDCEYTIHQVYFYLDGELTVYRRWQITRHLNRCPPCKHGFDFELELRQVVADRCRDTGPRGPQAAASPTLSASPSTAPMFREIPEL